METEQLTLELTRLLRSWSDGKLDEIEVHQEAERILSRVGRPGLPRSDARSIPLEVVSHLDVLNHQLIVPADVPCILEFLATSPGQELEGWTRWLAYWASVDYECRRRELHDRPYYCT